MSQSPWPYRASVAWARRAAHDAVLPFSRMPVPSIESRTSKARRAGVGESVLSSVDLNLDREHAAAVLLSAEQQTGSLA